MPQSLDPTYPLYTVLSFLGFVVVLIPFSWHLQAWNVGTCAYMFWVSLACLVEFINSVVWAGNLDNNIPVWCDITTKFLLGAGVGIVASALCINRRLYSIASIKTASISYIDKRRMVIIDLCISLGMPVLVMILHYIVQPHRYDILEDIGCQPAIYNTLPAYFLVFMWPVLLGLISFVYSALTLRAFWKRRLQFAQLISTHSALNISRYIRLMLLALLNMTMTVPLGVFSIYLASYGVPLAPWISWENVHFNFSQVDLVPSLIWRTDPSFSASVELTRWLFPVSAFLFFALFGFASEAQKQYNILFHKCRKVLGPKSATSKSSKPSYLPSHGYDWTGQHDAKTQSEYVPTSPGKASRFSLTPSNDATLPVDLDIEKSSGLGSPISTTCPTDSYPPFSSAPYPSSYPEVYIASPEHPGSDDADTFTISTFSYYSGTPSPSSHSHRFKLTHLPPTPEPQGLSPPPVSPIIKRPIPRDVPSSADSIMVGSLSRSSSPDIDLVTTTVPQDVTESLSGRRMMNAPGGILVTVQKQSSIDRMV